jgi:hypothetical protein
MGSEDHQEEVVTAAEGSAGEPPAGEGSATSSQRRRRGSRGTLRLPRLRPACRGYPPAQRTASGAGRGRTGPLGRPTRPGGGPGGQPLPSARPGLRARRQQEEPPDSSPGSGYAIRVEGLLDAHWSQWLEGMTITREGGGVTRIEGPLMDQAALHGVLNKLRDLRLPIVTVQRLGALGSDAPIQRTIEKQC